MTNMTFTKGIGTPIYMSPEILNKKHYKMPADIYSFAITMLEVMIWNEAFPKSMYKYPWEIANEISAGKRPITIEQIQNETMKLLIEKTWDQNPLKRLLIDQLILQLENELIKSK